MKLLHTADWHVGKALRGRSRLEEHERVLGEIVEIARVEAVDLVVVAGDIFETSAPAPDAQKVAWDALLALRATGAHVLAIAGNHDSPHMFDAVRPLFAAAGIQLLGHPSGPADGGVVSFPTAAGDTVRVALLPFVSQRFAVRARELFELSGAAGSTEYTADYRALVHHLCADVAPGTISVLVAHATVINATFGGGERAAHSIFEYAVPPNVFPIDAHYVALGHLHRAQSIPAGCPAWYSGSPIQVDFGETANAPQVLIVEAHANTPAQVRPVTLSQADRLLTVEGTLAELAARVDELGDAWLRVRVRESLRAGLADDVRTLLPRTVDVAVVGPAGSSPADTAPAFEGATRHGRSPHDLFSDYCRESGIEDPRVVALFDALLGEVSQ